MLKTNNMKKTSSVGKVLLVAFAVASGAAFIINMLETAIGAHRVFFGAICLLPIIFVWCLLTGEMKRK